MKTKKSLSLLVILILSFSSLLAQNNNQYQKEFENNLKNALIQGVVDAVTGNTSSETPDANSLIPGGNIQGMMFLTNGNIKEFVGVRSIGMNNGSQSSSSNGRPIVWIFDNYSWRSVYLSDVATITFNNLEYLGGSNYRLSVSVSLKDGSSYNYMLNPSTNTMTVIARAGNDARDEQVPLFNPGQLFVNNIVFY